MKNKYLIVILGPTASGKTSLGISMARFFNADIISADSRQFYKELRIGTAVPDKQEMADVTHHLMHHISVNDYYNASMFEQDVLGILEKLFLKNDLVLMVGGSGLYIDAVCHGIDDLPPVDHEIRNLLKERIKLEGIESLRFDLKKLDPIYYASTDLHNPKRILKALEICMMTGRSYSSFLTNPQRVRDFRIIKIGLNLPRELLYQRINNRVDKMIGNGLVDEARSLQPLRYKNALNTVGYKEIFRYFDGETTLEKAIELIKRNTRHFARRQLTWFNRDKTIKWFHPDEGEKIIRYISDETGDVKYN